MSDGIKEVAEQTSTQTQVEEKIEVVDLPKSDEAIETKTSAEYGAGNIRVL